MRVDGLSYEAVGVTDPALVEWPDGPHRLATTVSVGSGTDCWTASREAIFTWAVKTRSGFRVVGGPERVQPDQDCVLIFQVGPMTVREPVRVVAVVDEPNRCGFAYGTRPGHPVSGEEAFIVHRDPAGAVHLTVRSLTLPAAGWRRLAFPAFVAAQRRLRPRYLKALAG